MKTHKVLLYSLPLPNTVSVFNLKLFEIEFDFSQASAKRFRVTGAGKIIRRRAGKQHLLYKKNKKRKLRLSKLVSLFFYIGFLM